MRGVCQRFDRELVGVMEPKYAKLKNHYPRVHLKDTPSIKKKTPTYQVGVKRENR